jgi:hypothetical protein
MGAVTVAIVRRDMGQGATVAVTADVTFSGTYAAGGDTYVNSQFGLTRIDSIEPQGAAVASATTGFIVAPDLPNKKLRLFGGAAAGIAFAESAVANQSATVCRVIVRGDNPNI